MIAKCNKYIFVTVLTFLFINITKITNKFPMVPIEYVNILDIIWIEYHVYSLAGTIWLFKVTLKLKQSLKFSKLIDNFIILVLFISIF